MKTVTNTGLHGLGRASSFFLIGFSYFSRPSDAEIQERMRQDSIQTIERLKAEEEIKAKEATEIAQPSLGHLWAFGGF